MSRVGYDSSRYYEEKAKLPKADGLHCITCGIEFDKTDKRRSYCSQVCFSKWYCSLAVDSWARIRDQVLKRDGRCVECGLKFNSRRDNFRIIFEVHHVKPICEGGDEFDSDNCITLCYDCHREMHTCIGKKKRNNKSLDDFVY